MRFDSAGAQQILDKFALEHQTHKTIVCHNTTTSVFCVIPGRGALWCRS